MKPSHYFKACLYNFLLLLLFALGSVARLPSPLQPPTPFLAAKETCLCRPPAGRTRGRGRRRAVSGTAAPIPVPRDLCSRSASARGASGARREPTPADAAPCRAGNGTDFHATESSAARDVQLCIHLPRYNAPRWSARPSLQSLRVRVPRAAARSRDWDAAGILQSLLCTPFPVPPLTPRFATGVPLGSALPEAGWRCARPRWGRGWILWPCRLRRVLRRS